MRRRSVWRSRCSSICRSSRRRRKGRRRGRRRRLEALRRKRRGRKSLASLDQFVVRSTRLLAIILPLCTPPTPRKAKAEKQPPHFRLRVLFLLPTATSVLFKMATEATGNGVQALPYISLQPSTSLVIQDLLAPNSTIAAEDVWCSAYRSGGPQKDGDQAAAPSGSVHGRFRLSEGDEEGTVEVQSRDDKVEVELKSKVRRAVLRPLACPR